MKQLGKGVNAAVYIYYVSSCECSLNHKIYQVINSI